MSSESKTYLGDVEFSLVAGNNVNALDSAVDGPAETSHITSINGIYSIGNAWLFTDNNQMRLFTPTNEHIKWMSAIRHGHEAYGMVSKHLSKNYKDSKRQEVFTTKMKQLKRRKKYFNNWQEEVTLRLPGRRSLSYGRLGAPASKTMENPEFSYKFKKKLPKLLNELGIADKVNQVSFTSKLRLEGMFGLYNAKQIVPSPLEFKYLTPRSSLESALKSCLGLKSSSGRQERYHHEDDCIIPVEYKKRKDDTTFIKATERIKGEAEEMRQFCRQYTKGSKVMNLRHLRAGLAVYLFLLEVM